MATAKGPDGAESRDYFDTPWTSGLLRPLLIAVLATSLAGGPTVILRTATSWRLGYMLPLAFLVALVAVYNTAQLGRPSWRDKRRIGFRLGELLAGLVLLKLAIWLFSTGLPSGDDLWFWVRHPGAFFDGQFVVMGILLWVAWGLAVAITGDFMELALQPDEVAAHESMAYGESRSEMRASRPVSRTDLLGRFVSRWVWGGVILVFCASLSQVTITADATTPFRLGIAHAGLPPDILAALLAYFLAGLLLISQGRLAVLRGRWYNQRIEVLPVVLRRWYINSVLILLVVAGVAALLPIGSTGWLSSVLGTVVALLLRAAYFVMFLFALLLSLLFYPLRFLQGSDEGAGPMEVPQMAVPTQAEARRMLPDWLGGTVVWIIIVLIVGYLVVNYLAAHGVFQGRFGSLLSRFRFWWRARWGRLAASIGAATKGVRERLAPVRPKRQASSARFVRVGRLPPRERVRYFYLRMVEHAGDRGLGRPPHKTPLEFAGDLRQQWPEAELDVDGLTEAFLAARYAEREIELSEARSVQGIWRRVMRALRGKPGSTDASGAPPGPSGPA